MTDLEKIKEMLGKAGIRYKFLSNEGEYIISIERGYTGFVTEITFDKYGELRDIGAYE